MAKQLSPEAYGVLQALVGLQEIRIVERSVERELTELHFAKKVKNRLRITKEGHEAATELRKREIKRIRKDKKPDYLST